MKKLKKASSSANVLRYLWGSTAATLILTSILSWWLLSGSWAAWHSARNNVIQFDNFYQVLLVSNDLASERAYANELVLSPQEKKAQAGASLDNSRQITDRDLAKIPADLLSPALLRSTIEQLKPARNKVDQFREVTLSDPVVAQRAIDSMVAATDFYHEALFRRTSEFLLLEPSALGPILRAQALGELRDATGRLGAQLIIPVATHTPIPLGNIEALSRGKERIAVLWWLLRTQGAEAHYLPGFMQQLESTRDQFEKQGVAMIDSLVIESESGQPYSVDAANFALRYHASLGSFNELLDTYLAGVKKHYVYTEQQALLHLMMVVVILIVLNLLAMGLIFYVRSRVLRPILRLNEIATGIIAGKQQDTLMNDSTAEEVQELFSSLGTLGDKLREQTRLSKTLQRQSEEDPLTNLLNRRAFDALGGNLLKLASPQQPAWLIMMDVDHFKSINDTWGHPTGDKVLVQLATTLKKFSRPGDVIGRLGGEEFAMIFCSPGHEDVTGYTTRIQNEIRRLRFEGPKGEPFSITASFGVASGWQQELSDMLAQADAALYEAKNSGRDRVCGLP
ncbi:GGDEF domain-containing protein [Scandinavium lactucae]|uniref:diguanylate cyclase n=1 Tax=Scandinavium lactucae TaxID=3095028 RepID=A0ABU4QPZ0_9ENTR|nr:MULTISPECIES: GGDEF domain-containing protein [unclassified Scandinavium]MDX6039345.1 GGDEF domain-containing protein [Scandinavium sp. V105_6]MDX6050416.1 GGDEF domain-containing protein [Scandinavium sp. V105_1]